MTLDHLAEIAAELDVATPDVLGESVAELERAALSHGLAVITPATVEASGVTLGSTMSASDVVEIAVRLGASALYLDRELIETDSIVECIQQLEIEPEDRAARDSSLRALRRINGYTHRIDVGFIHLGVPHSWSQDTAFADDLEEIDNTVTALLAETSNGPDSPVDVTGLVEALASDPAFRRARTRFEHETAARALPALAPILERGDRWKLIEIIQGAQGLLNQQRIDLVDELEERLPELATSLAATDQFRSASSAEGRRKVALKWVMALHTNELGLPRDFITELAAAAHKATSGQLGLL
ncbi:hypothetical protein [Nocardia puris]|nr:hypothetical protein [Nocardia puris]